MCQSAIENVQPFKSEDRGDTWYGCGLFGTYLDSALGVG